MNTAIYVSLLLTFPTIVACIFVLYVWTPHLPREAKHWLLVGIAFSFVGSIVDNTWWGIAWYLRREDDPSWHWWFDHGVYSNIFFRQAFKLIAAYCHIKAAIIEREARMLNRMFFLMIITSLALCLIAI